MTLDAQRTFPRDLPHPLTDAEVRERFHKAQELEERADELDTKLKDETKERRDAIKRQRTEAKSLRAVAHKEQELRSVLCREELRGSQVFVVRDDNGAIVDQRPATAEDQQLDVFPGLGTPTPASKDLPLPPEYSPRASDGDPPSEASGKASGKKRGRGGRAR